MDHVGNDERRGDFADRLARLRMSQRELAAELEMNPKTIGKAMADPWTVSRASYDRIDAGLERLRSEMGMDDEPPARVAPGTMVYRVRTPDGRVELVVEAAVEDARDAEQSVARLLAGLQKTDS